MSATANKVQRESEAAYKRATKLLDNIFLPPGIATSVSSDSLGLRIVFWRTVECLCGTLVTVLPCLPNRDGSPTRRPVTCPTCHRPVTADFQWLQVTGHTTPSQVRATLARLIPVDPQDAADHAAAIRTARRLRHLPTLFAITAGAICAYYFLIINQNDLPTRLVELALCAAVAAFLTYHLTHLIIDMSGVEERLLRCQVFLWGGDDTDRRRYAFRYQPTDQVRAAAQKMPEGTPPVR